MVQRRLLRAMIVGDSITHGKDGDHTWRYRLWEWLKQENIEVEFVGPYDGTYVEGENPPDQVDVSQQQQLDNTALVTRYPTGKYAPDVAASFPKQHYSWWGRQARQVIDTIGDVVATYKPQYVLLMLGFNDLAWFATGVEGTLESVRSVVRNTQASAPDTHVLVANIVQRTFLGGANATLPARTQKFNEALRDSIADWSTPTSKVRLVDVEEHYNCGPESCPDGYDGLHPNKFGEYHIAEAFSKTLQEEHGFGKNPFVDPYATLN
jgi:hypothetical protein